MSLATDALNIITSVKYDVDLINMVNKMTFLFDPNWQAVGNTLPISFFYVKDFKEVMESEVSQKPLLFYNSQKEANKDMVSGGLLGMVSDNIIAKPKKYQMSIIIPRSIDVYIQQFMYSKSVGFSKLPTNPILHGLDTSANIFLELVSQLVRTLNAQGISSVVGTYTYRDYISDNMSSGINDTNKTSLDKMWENRTILRMKYWNGWKFKYVAIESYIPSKLGDESDFFEATLNLTEVPILTTRKTGILPLFDNTAISKDKTASISAMLDKIESKNNF